MPNGYWVNVEVTVLHCYGKHILKVHKNTRAEPRTTHVTGMRVYMVLLC